MTTAKDRLIAACRAAFKPNLPRAIGVAVSGGSDSVALLHGLFWALQDQNVDIHVATVDHGLRPEAAAEAQFVADLSRRLGLSHKTLRWDEPRGAGNLQARARAARYDLLSAWANENHIDALVLGHTADDQAETVLMRLRREAGVNGLAGIAPRRSFGRLDLLRPMLGLRRENLRDVLRQENVSWVDDPSNEDECFERVRTRKALATLADLGIPADAFSRVAENLSQARKALDWYSFLAADDVISTRAGAVVISQREFRVLPQEIAHRLIAQSVQWLTGDGYVPRRGAMQDAIKAVQRGEGFTFSGCRILSRRGVSWLFREYNALADLTARPGQAWDGRWLMHGGVIAGDEAQKCEVRPLSAAGLRFCPQWRDQGCPGEVLQTTPSLWQNDELLAAPCAGMANGWAVTLIKPEEALFSSFLTH